jgi:hypothetical protein
MSLNLGGEVGFYGVHTSYEGSESYTVTGGLPTPVDQTVVNENGMSGDDDTTAFSAGASASISMPVGAAMLFTLGGGVDYLSKVATLERGSAADVVSTTSYPDDDSTASYDAAEDLSPSISYGSGASWRLTGSLSGHF